MGVPLYLIHPASLGHLTGPGHPDAPGRIGAIERELERRDWCGHVRRQAGAAPEPAIAAVHTADHIARCGPAGALDAGETVVGPGSLDAALHAAGAAIALVDALVTGEASTGFCAVRPPVTTRRPPPRPGSACSTTWRWRRSMRSTARVCDA